MLGFLSQAMAFQFTGHDLVLSLWSWQKECHESLRLIGLNLFQICSLAVKERTYFSLKRIDFIQFDLLGSKCTSPKIRPLI